MLVCGDGGCAARAAHLVTAGVAVQAAWLSQRSSAGSAETAVAAMRAAAIVLPSLLRARTAATSRCDNDNAAVW